MPVPTCHWITPGSSAITQGIERQLFTPPPAASQRGMLSPALSIMLRWIIVLVMGTTWASAWADISIADERFTLEVLDHAVYFEDVANDLDIQAISDGTREHQFLPLSKLSRFLANTHSTYWLRFSVHNTSAYGKTFSLAVNQDNRHYIKLFSANGQNFSEITSDPHYPTYLYALSLKAQEKTTLYLKLPPDRYLNLRVLVGDALSFHKSLSIEQLCIGIGLGLMLALFGFNAVAYLSTRMTSQGLQSVYMFCILALYVINAGYSTLIHPDLGHLSRKLETMFAYLACASGTLLAKHFLAAQRTSPWLNNTMLSLIALDLTGAWATFFLQPGLSEDLCILTVTITLIAWVLFGFSLWQQGHRDACSFMAIKSIFMLALSAFFIAIYAGNIPFMMPSDYIIAATLSLEALAMTLLILVQYNREKEQCHSAQINTQVEKAGLSAKQELFDKISHDIRTPMNGILGMSELLKDTSLSATQTEYIHTINTAGNQLVKLLDNMRDRIKLSKNTLTIDSAPFDLSDLLDDCLDCCKESADAKHTELVGFIRTGTPCNLVGDYAHLKQVVNNLVGLAIDNTESGEVILEIGQIHQPCTAAFEFKIRYSGHDVTPLVQAHPDSRLELVVARDLIHAMGGHITLPGGEEDASAITFSIGLEINSYQANLSGSDANLLGRRLLIVDDNASCCHAIEQQANHWGLQALTALGGKQALATLHNQASVDQPVEIIILDHDMPGMTGLELANKIKRDPLISSDIIIIMMTGLSISPPRESTIDANIRRVLVKPVSGRTLKAALNEELTRNTQVGCETSSTYTAF